MGIESKTRLLNSFKKRLTTVLTAADMETVTDILSEELANYDIKWIERETSEKDDLLDAYIEALEIEGRSPKTLGRYKYIITRFLNFVAIPTEEITVFDIRRYLSTEKKRGISDRTLDGIRQIFSAYFNWLQREGLIRVNPMGNVGTIKYRKIVKDIYSDIDIEKMKEAAKSVRDKAIIFFLLSSGCRISEMIALNRVDVDLEKLECKILGKGNKERIIYLSPVAGMYIKQYFDERKDTNEALFLSQRGSRLTISGAENILNRIGAASEVEHVHPHKFRRTLATNLIKRGMPIEEVAKILGHDKLDTTMQYIVLDKSEIKYSYKKYTS